MINGVDDLRIDDDGQHVMRDNMPELIPVDTIIVCAGQDPARTLYDEAQAKGLSLELVGGACKAAALLLNTSSMQRVEALSSLENHESSGDCEWHFPVKYSSWLSRFTINLYNIRAMSQSGRVVSFREVYSSTLHKPYLWYRDFLVHMLQSIPFALAVGIWSGLNTSESQDQSVR